MNPTDNLPTPSPSTQSRPSPKEKRREDRRGEDRREDDRRITERRVGDRRAGEPYGKWKPKRKVRKETKVLLALLSAAVVLLILNIVYLNPGPQAKQKMVEVEIEKIGVWRCSPVVLSEFFATQDSIKQVADGKKVVSEKILTEMTQIRSKGLEKSVGRKDNYLLNRVREMPWQEFEKRAEFTPKRRAVGKPSPQEWEVAIKSARIAQ